MAIAVLSFTATRSDAQPTLTAENSVPAVLGEEVSLSQYLATSPAEVGAVLMETGEDVTWDISAFDFGEIVSTTLNYQEPPFDDVPGWTVFQNIDPQPNYVNVIRDVIDEEQFPDTTELAFYSLASSEELVNFGFGAFVDYDEDGNDDEVVIANDPPEIQYSYPVSFGDAWMTESTQQFIVVGVAQFPGGTVTKNSRVESWGTLVTSAGEAPVLQIITDQTISSFGIVSSTTTEYEFIGPFIDGSGKSAAVRAITASMSVSGGSVTSASFTVGETEGGGDPTSIEDVAEIPGRFEINANYPNPFNPATAIDYTVVTGGRATMTVHDVLGRQVDTVFDEVVAAGRHSVRWEAGDLPSGIYQIRMAMDGEARTMPIILQK